jgi:NitT/TauT family transport system substrate-binding protein
MAHQKFKASLARASVHASLLVALGASACSGLTPALAPTTSSATTPTAPAAITVRAGTGTGIGRAGQLLAQSDGYFAAEGLAIDSFNSDPSTTLAALLAGQIDVAGLGMDSGLFTAIQQGVKIRIVAPQASSEANASGVFFVVRKDLTDAGRVREYRDLRGLKIAVSARGNSTEYVLARAMQDAGLALGDANLVVLNFPDMVTGLASKAIDVGVLSEPQATIAVQNGTGVKWKGYADIVPGIQQTVVVLSPEFAANRDVATRWMTAYIRGIRDYNDAFVKNMHRQLTVDTLANALSVSPKVFDDMSFSHIDPDAKLNLGAMEDQMRWSVQMGYLPGPVDMASVVDPSFAEAVVAQLGPYR